MLAEDKHLYRTMIVHTGRYEPFTYARSNFMRTQYTFI